MSQLEFSPISPQIKMWDTVEVSIFQEGSEVLISAHHQKNSFCDISSWNKLKIYKYLAKNQDV